MLTKPGIILGNAITGFGGFALASHGKCYFPLLLSTLFGLSLIVASGCVFNNFIDRHHDKKMARTKNRPLAKGAISSESALLYALILLAFGIMVLVGFTNALALTCSLVGFFVYVLWYSFLKHVSVHGTLIGSLAGAMPPVVGYVAVSHKLDLASFLLFLIIALWQMPHFFAIAIYRLKEYTAAAIPVLPVKKGIALTKVHMVVYTVGFVIASVLLGAFHEMGPFYLIVSASLGLLWLALCLFGFRASDETYWAKKMFYFSLIVITALCVSIPLSLKS